MDIELWSPISTFSMKKLKINNFQIMLVSWATKWIKLSWQKSNHIPKICGTKRSTSYKKRHIWYFPIVFSQNQGWAPGHPVQTEYSRAVPVEKLRFFCFFWFNRKIYGRLFRFSPVVRFWLNRSTGCPQGPDIFCQGPDLVQGPDSGQGLYYFVPRSGFLYQGRICAKVRMPRSGLVPRTFLPRSNLCQCPIYAKVRIWSKVWIPFLAKIYIFRKKGKAISTIWGYSAS